MAVRIPSSVLHGRQDSAATDPLAVEILAEKAAALGRAAHRAGSSLERLAEHSGDGQRRRELLMEAAEAVQAYFIQREVCGLARHDDAIRELHIPREVLARLGASGAPLSRPPAGPRDNLP